jgi:hypothetical protein
MAVVLAEINCAVIAHIGVASPNRNFQRLQMTIL